MLRFMGSGWWGGGDGGRARWTAPGAGGPHSSEGAWTPDAGRPRPTSSSAASATAGPLDPKRPQGQCVTNADGRSRFVASAMLHHSAGELATRRRSALSPGLAQGTAMTDRSRSISVGTDAPPATDVSPHGSAGRWVEVWDLPTRAPEWWMGVHVSAGYGLVALMAFRIVWSIFRPEYSRVVSFIYPPRETLEHLKGLLLLRPPHHVGHNPTGALMVFALAAVLIALVVTGLLVLGGEEKQEPRCPICSKAHGGAARPVSVAAPAGIAPAFHLRRRRHGSDRSRRGGCAMKIIHGSLSSLLTEVKVRQPCHRWGGSAQLPARSRSDLEPSRQPV